MTASNVVRFRVKPEAENAFLDAHREQDMEFAGMRRFSLFKTGDHTYCIVGEWDSFDDIVAARPLMIGVLDTIRGHLEDLGEGLGLTDPVSGTVVIEKAKAQKTAKPKGKKAPAKKAAKKTLKKAAKKPAKKAVKMTAKKPAKKAAKAKKTGRGRR